MVESARASLEIPAHARPPATWGRPIWKPMHMQPIYQGSKFVSVTFSPVNEDIFERGLCLPSDNKMTKEEQDRVIELVRACFE